MIQCELDLTSNPFSDKTILTYEIELPLAGNKIGFNLLDDEDFTIPYFTDTTPNSPGCHQITTQAKVKVLIIDTNKEEPITSQGALGELNRHKTPSGKYKVNISLFRRKRYQRTYLEEICSRFDQVRPVVSHIEVRLPDKPPTPKNIGEALKVPHTQ